MIMQGAHPCGRLAKRPQPAGAPRLWQRSSPPTSDLPLCRCGSPLAPTLLHSPAPSTSWSAQWFCSMCGPSEGNPQAAAAMELTADHTLPQEWEALVSARGFWQRAQSLSSARLQAAKSIRDNWHDARPAIPLLSNTDSAIYVPLLADAAGLLAQEARQDWQRQVPG